QLGSPLVRLEPGAINSGATHQGVYERGNVVCLKATDQASTDGLKSVVVAVGANVTAIGILIAPLVETEFGLRAEVVVEEICAAEQAADIDCLIAGRNGASVGKRCGHVPFG